METGREINLNGFEMFKKNCESVEFSKEKEINLLSFRRFFALNVEDMIGLDIDTSTR